MPAQHPQPGDDVGGEVGEVAHHLALGEVAALQRLEQRAEREEQERARRQHDEPERDRGAQQQDRDDDERDDRRRPRGRAMSIALPMWERSLVPIATTSPVATRLGSVAPRWTAWRVTSCTTRYAAVSQFVTASRCRRMPATAWSDARCRA